MTRTERKLSVQTTIIGAVLTAVVTLAHVLGWLTPLNNWLYDRRVRHCQFFAAPPTDKLIHIDIDDRSLQAKGRWPWPRTYLAQIIEQLQRAGAKVIGLDMIFSESQQPEYRPGDDEKSLVKINHDEQLAQAVARHGNVLIPLSLTHNPNYLTKDYQRAMVEVFYDDLEITGEQLAKRLQRDIDRKNLKQQVFNRFLELRREAMHVLIDRELGRRKWHRDQLRQLLLPHTDTTLVNSPLLNQFDEVYEQVRSIRLLRRFARPATTTTTRPLSASSPLPPIAKFSAVAGMTGFVDYLPYDDGVVRSVPLWTEHRGWLFPQMGLAMACAQLGADINQVRIEPHHIVIHPAHGPSIRVPVRRHRMRGPGTEVDLIFDVPLLGQADRWETMYDWPSHQEPKQHMPAAEVFRVRELRDKFIKNNITADGATIFLLNDLDQAKAIHLHENPFAKDDFDSRVPVIKQTLEQLEGQFWFAQIQEMAPQEREEHYTQVLAARDALYKVLSQNAQLKDQVPRAEQRLSQKVKGKSVLIGWTARGIAADFVPTSLHFKCPGVVIHGAIFNAILTGEMWKTAPLQVGLLLTLGFGILVTLATALISPLRATVASLAIGTGYLAINGIVLFDKYNLNVNVAGPLVAMGIVWSGCTLSRFIIERRERWRVENRFRSYVDPALVDWVVEHPEQSTLEGQLRELTVVFTDLAGFTTLSEQLRERTVPILNDYMQLMVPIIRQHNGYVNKFLGDGIMFFYGAPRGNQNHAIDAVRTSLKMQEAMVGFNRQLVQQDLPSVKMRVGISSGNMVVGDAGSADASDYTVLGDAVNLGSRLESANKATGTSILLNARVALFTEDEFLLRPIGRLQVVGKTQGVMTFEPLCTQDQANDDARQLVNMTNDMVNAYILGQFENCAAVSRKIDATFGESTLTTLYRQASQRFEQDPPGPEFLGQIVLEEK